MKDLVILYEKNHGPLQTVHKIRLTTPCISAEIITLFLCVYLDGDNDDDDHDHDDSDDDDDNNDDDSGEFFVVVNLPYPQLEHLRNISNTQRIIIKIIPIIIINKQNLRSI